MFGINKYRGFKRNVFYKYIIIEPTYNAKNLITSA